MCPETETSEIQSRPLSVNQINLIQIVSADAQTSWFNELGTSGGVLISLFQGALSSHGRTDKKLEGTE